VGVIMTGMGEDGVAGLGRISAAGGTTIAQSRDSCVVDSMPRAAIERGYAHRVIALGAMPKAWEALCAMDRMPVA
jgi:two-component system chemotaxis response regulator CheB